MINKKLHTQVWAKLISLLLIVGMSGCAVFSGDKVPHTELAPLAEGAKKPSIVYEVTAKSGLSEPKPVPEIALNAIEGELVGVLEESGYFSSIATQDVEADIKLAVELVNHGNPAALIPAVITGLSLYTIPSWATDHFKVTATVSTKDGRQSEYQLEDQTTLVQWLPMIFVFPVKNFSVIGETRENMYRNVLEQMQNDGLLPK